MSGEGPINTSPSVSAKSSRRQSVANYEDSINNNVTNNTNNLSPQDLAHVKTSNIFSHGRYH